MLEYMEEQFKSPDLQILFNRLRRNRHKNIKITDIGKWTKSVRADYPEMGGNGLTSISFFSELEKMGFGILRNNKFYWEQDSGVIYRMFRYRRF